MPDDSLPRVTVYKLQMTVPSDLALKKYDKVADGTKTASGRSFKYRLYFLRQSSSPPPQWLKAFEHLPLQLNQGKKPVIHLPGFVMLVWSQKDFYALCGGQGHIALRAENSIESRFGTILSQKILSMPELRGLVQKDTSGVVMRLDRVFRGSYNPHGEIDNLRRVLSTVRGSIDKTNKHYADIGKSIQAGNALTVSGAKTFDELFKFIASVDKLWKSKTTLIDIPQLEHIGDKTDPALVSSLQDALIDAIAAYKPSIDMSLFIDTEDDGYLPDQVATYKLLGVTPRQTPVETHRELLDSVASILKPINTADSRRDTFEKMKVKVVLADESVETHPLSHVICGDITYNNESYFINHHLWYRANKAYLGLLDRQLDYIACVDPRELGLVVWDTSKFKGNGGELKFNTACCKHSGHLLLDQRTVRIPNERGPIEFCDILAIDSTFVRLIHVKKATGAALRELFAQGYVSADLYRGDDFRDLVHKAQITNGDQLTTNEKAELADLKKRSPREFQVVYAICDPTPNHTIPAGAKLTSKVLKGTLTPFAKIDLLNRVQDIRGMGYGDVAVSRIDAK